MAGVTVSSMAVCCTVVFFVRGVVSAFLFLPLLTGWTAATDSVAETRLSGTGESEESEDVFLSFLAMVCIAGKSLSVAGGVCEPVETVDMAEC